MESSTPAYIGAALTAAAVTYYATKNRSELDPLYNFDEQSIEIDPVEHVRIASTLKNRELVQYRFNDVRTLYEVLPKGLQLSGNGPCLGHRINGKGPYVWITYNEVIERTRFIGSGLLNKGVKAVNTSNVAIYSRNRPEWTIAEYACYAYSLNVISLYDSYGESAIKYVMNQAEISTIFVDSYDRLLNIYKTAHELPYLRLIVHFDDLNPIQYSKLNFPSTVELVSWSDLMKLGRNNLRSPVPPKPSDVATICYTSGTTGYPKGAMITHANLIANEAAIYERLNKPHLNVVGTSFDSSSLVNICFLPLAHMLERMSTILLFLKGGRMGYISGDITTLLDDCKELKPTNIAMVPRLLNKLYDRVMGEIGNNKVKLFLLKKAIASKEADRKLGIVRRDTIYDRIIFKKIRDIFGGQISRIGTGGAPMTRDVFEFSRSAFSCPVSEGYGQTEATCSITFTHSLEPELGHVGPPNECTMVKLVDVPSMNYYAKNGQGEICAKGPGIFKGYYKDPEKTAEVIDADGWLHTGDIGMWLPNGCLKIIDRIKHLFKLSQGEYISPEKVESVYIRSLFAAQIFADGDPSKDFVIAIVVPEQEYLMSYCKQQAINGSFKELCANKEVRRLIMNDFNQIGNKSGLMSYEKIKNIHIHDELFTLENNLVTPTLKLKRANLRVLFKDVIANLYKEIPVRTSKL